MVWVIWAVLALTTPILDQEVPSSLNRLNSSSSSNSNSSNNNLRQPRNSLQIQYLEILAK
jgi:hypothetical protein